jgi:hypothetical protein
MSLHGRASVSLFGRLYAAGFDRVPRVTRGGFQVRGCSH